ncbi:hypothetical protein LBMAG27_17390 [Bacteroidota bacterium]|nr:hypothetical protein LBMAG27_17390 [Bacteroidota bacterium]
MSDTAMTTLLEGLVVSISNLTINCNSQAYGHFNGSSELSITNGVVISTGNANALADSSTAFLATANNTPGDSDLSALCGTVTYDACVLEFDCVPTGDTLEFNFAFGSEEYPEFVGTPFNDVFAILLSGPGISGVQNVAAIPGGIPVAINNVNATNNSAYFYDNENPPGVYIVLDGFTLNLTAFAVVIPGSSYHFKIAIADASDFVFDSGVFLEAFSFRSNGGSANAVKAIDNTSFKVFPNPASDRFTITSLQPLNQVRIINLTGDLVHEYSTTEKYLQVSTDEFSSGVYIVESVSAENYSVSKLIVQ